MRLMRGDVTDAPARKLYVPAPIPGYEKVAPLPHDAQIRVGFGRMIEGDPLRVRNRAMLLHGSLISGRVAFDFSNPYTFLSRLYLNKPTLVPTWQNLSQSPESITTNIAAGNMQLKKTW
jgi:hypothetical protein